MATYTYPVDTVTQQYHTPLLLSELTTAALTCVINGHGPSSFTITSDDLKTSIDTVVNTHINRSTAAHDAAVLDYTNDQIVDFGNVDKFLTAYSLCLNDGTIVPGAAHTNAYLKAAVKAKL